MCELLGMSSRRPVLLTFVGYTIPGIGLMLKAAAALQRQTGRQAGAVFEQWSRDSDANISARGRAAVALVKGKT
ncbi:MAG: hypothetical protein HGB05_08365 [Chloroflexi bacterium]|nr:hypothetical protein [Chloroflexota bacterium]